MGGIVDVSAVQENKVLVRGAAANVESNGKVGEGGHAGERLDSAYGIGFDRGRGAFEFSNLEEGAPRADIKVFSFFSFPFYNRGFQLDDFFPEEDVQDDVCGVEFYSVLECGIADRRS